MRLYLFSLLSAIAALIITPDALAIRCARNYSGPLELNLYIKSSAHLPVKFNILALRQFQRDQGLPQYAILNPRFSRSYHLLYGKKGSNTIEEHLESPIAHEFGKGWMARVVQLEDGRVYKLIIREHNRTSNVGILFETEAWVTYQLKKHKRRYGIDVLPILNVGPNGMYLEKPLVDSKKIGSAIYQANGRLTQRQVNALQNLHQKAIRLAQETGISLDLKADNMFWDGEKWILFDPIGSISYKGYARTSDVPNFKDFFRRWHDSNFEDDGLTIDQVVETYGIASLPLP